MDVIPLPTGGILWCLGQFDRPFTPPQPVFGTVRTRSTQQQAKRLDPAAYRRQVTRPLWDPIPRVAVIGAGISGLTCARVLADHGCQVAVYEKSGGFGGRLSTRRTDRLSFDHGAQYFTVRDQRFKRYVDSWLEDGLVQPWSGRMVVVEKGTISAAKSGVTRYVAVPRMNSVCDHLAADLTVYLDTTVAPPKRFDDQWMLATTHGAEVGRFDFVVVAVPSHQATTLFAGAPKLAEQANGIKMHGCWALMLAFEESLRLGFDAAFVNESPLSWIARNNSKPGRDQGSETWVAHANPEWTEAHIDLPNEQVRQVLLEEFSTSVGRRIPAPSHADTKRWRFAIAKQPLVERCLFDASLGIGACGDWCGSPRVEGAFLSGMSIAGRILGHRGGGDLGLPKPKQLALF